MPEKCENCFWFDKLSPESCTLRQKQDKREWVEYPGCFIASKKEDL